jgi:hypothetical protein
LFDPSPCGVNAISREKEQLLLVTLVTCADGDTKGEGNEMERGWRDEKKRKEGRRAQKDKNKNWLIMG